MTNCPFDDDLFDALILVERAGCARFRPEDLAPVLRISPRSIAHFVKKGVLEEPHHELAPSPSHDHPFWTPEQVARAVVARGLVG